MATLNNRTACRKCGSSILLATAEHHKGKCALCAKKKWQLQLRELFRGLSLFAVWPFLALMGGSVMLWNLASAWVPGTRGYLTRRVANGWNPDWLLVTKIWGNAPCLYKGPIGPSAGLTLEYLLLQRLAHNLTIPSSVVVESLDARAPMRTAYCVELLSMRDDRAILDVLPAEIMKVSRSVQTQVGCFRWQGIDKQGAGGCLMNDCSIETTDHR